MVTTDRLSSLLNASVMRYLLILLLTGWSAVASAKITHIRYTVHTCGADSAQLPTHWDLYLDGDRYRLEEVGVEFPVVWLGQIHAQTYDALLPIFGMSIALLDQTCSMLPWKRESEAAWPACLDEVISEGKHPTIAGLEAQAYSTDQGAVAWLSADRMESPCVLGFPKLPLAFPLTDSDGAWLVMEFLSASEEDVEFEVGDEYTPTSRESLRDLLPSLDHLD